MDALTGSFPRQAASASLTASLVSFIGIVTQLQIHGNRPGALALGIISTLIIITGLVFGIIALAKTWNFRGTGLFVEALMGTLVNGLLLSGMIIYALILLMSGSRTGAEAAKDSQAAKHLAANYSAVSTYNQDGVQFSYGQYWTVYDCEVDTNLATKFGQNRVVAMENTGGGKVIYIALFAYNLTQANPSLEQYTRYLIRRVAGLTSGAMEHTNYNLSGTDLPALRCPLKWKGRDGTEWSGNGDFTMLENPRLRIVITALVAAGSDRTDLDNILGSLKIKGVNDVTVARRGNPDGPHVQMILYSPTRPTAMIANKTVTAGDTVQGYRVIAIDKEWISLRGPDGVTKVLQIGDGLD